MTVLALASTRLTRRAIFVLMIITALMVSIQSASADFSDGDKSERLTMTVAPESLPAEVGEHQILAVQIAGPTGVPILLSEPMTIRLFSSDPRVASVAPEFVIPAGSSFAIVTVHISGEAGAVSFTASADGVSPAHGALEVAEANEASVGTTLTIFPMPDRLIEGAVNPGHAMVAVVDSSGSPVISAFDIEVNLTSSDEKILKVPATVTIPAGSPGVFIDVAPIGAGSGQLTAVADGYSSSGIGIEVSGPSDHPSHLAASVVPKRWDHSGVGNPMLVVQAIDDDNLTPSYLPCGIVFLASSNPDLLSVPSQVDVPCGKDIASIEVPLVSTSGTGYAVVTVASPGLISTLTEFNAVNREPDELKSWVLPVRPASGDIQSPIVVIQLVDHEETPVAAPRPMPITVRTGDSTIEGIVQINAYDSYSAFPYTLIENQSGPVEMWLSATGVSSAPLSWSSTEMPVEAVIRFSDSWRYQSEPVIATITVNVQGRPIQGATVTWDVEDGYSYVPVSVTDENGQAQAEIYSSALGQAEVTARVTSDAIGVLEVKNNFDSVSLDQQFAPDAKLLGIPVGLLAWLVAIAAVLIVLFDFARSGQLMPWPPFGNKIGRSDAGSHSSSGSASLNTQPKSNLLRILAFRSGSESFPLPNLPIFDRISGDQLEFVRSEYAMRIESVADDGNAESVPSEQRDLIAGAVAVSALERLAERQTRDSEFEAAYKTAEMALNAASYLNNTRVAAGGDRFDRTRLWVLYSQALLNADHLDEAMAASQAATKTADQIGSQAMWASTIDELESRIRFEIRDSQQSA